MPRRIVFFSLLIVSQIANAQTAFLGTWEGTMNAGVELRMVFRISKDSSKNFVVTMDVPDQGLKDVKVNSLQFNVDSIRFAISQFGASYSGKLINDSSLSGNFYQGRSFPLNMKKVTRIIPRNRPQTPIPPFPYRSEELIYTNKDKSITYGATITIPQGKGPFPAAILLTGSGQQNRDEEILEHRPFAVIADHLTRNGFIVLRVDDRGIGKTTGQLLTATSRDFANDAVVGLNYLKSRKEVDKSRIGLIGHSEGGMIAQIIAAERKDIYFVVMLAAPGEKVMKLMKDQNEAILLKSGMPKDYVTSYIEVYESILKTIIASDSTEARSRVKEVVNTWIDKTPRNIVLATTGIRDENAKENFVNQFVNQVGHPWFKYFLTYDPAPYISKMRAKVLAVNGSRDIQVISKSNREAIARALEKSKVTSYEVKELEGLNHLFQECKSCTLAEYGVLEQTVSPKLLEFMTEWMVKRVGIRNK